MIQEKTDQTPARLFMDLKPKLLTILRGGYPKGQLMADLSSGVIVGIIALPLAIAFAIGSGVKPEQGLYTAIIAGFIVSAFGGSRVQIAGPTGAFVIIVYRIVQTYGYDGLMVATLMAGVLLIIMGLAGFGTLLRFIPYPLTVGFTGGIAVVIFSSQLNDFLGLRIGDLPADFAEKWGMLAHHMDRLDVNAAIVGTVALVIILGFQRFVPRVPGSLVAILVVTAAVSFFHIPVETVSSRFGEVPTTLPAPRFPDVSWATVTRLFSPAVTIAILGAIESLLSAEVADGMIRGRHRSNMELVAQGMANIASPVFLGIPATGAIARTAANVKNGGRTPVAGIVHAVFLLLVMLFLGKWVGLIPLSVLAAILCVVAYNMSEWRSFMRILRSPRSDVAVMILTFVLTIAVDLTAAIQVGVILSAFLFIRRMSKVSGVKSLTIDLNEERPDSEPELQNETLPKGVEVFEVYGSLFFGAADQFTETLRTVEKKTTAFILETKNLLSIDATGIRAVEELHRHFRAHGTRFIISGIHKQPLFALTQSGLLDTIGEENIFGSLREAISDVATGRMQEEGSA